LGRVACRGFGERDVADRLEQAPTVEPVHRCRGGELDRLAEAPSTALADYFDLEQADPPLGEGIFVTVADPTEGRFANFRRIPNR
jgi:hypothetical protein